MTRMMLCVRAVCTGSPPQPGHSSFACPSPALPGSVCYATCEAGYAGAPSATYQPDGTYSAVTGSCELIRESQRESDIDDSVDKTTVARQACFHAAGERLPSHVPCLCHYNSWH
jgi:hypothetical protein